MRILSSTPITHEEVPAAFKCPKHHINVVNLVKASDMDDIKAEYLLHHDAEDIFIDQVA